MVNISQSNKFDFESQVINLILMLNCPVVFPKGIVQSSINVSLTYLRSLEVPELTEGYANSILSFYCIH